MSGQALAREVIQRAPAGWERISNELQNPLRPQVVYRTKKEEQIGFVEIFTKPPEIMEYRAEERIHRREHSDVEIRRGQRRKIVFDPDLEKHPKSDELPDVPEDARWPRGEVIDELDGQLEFDEWRVMIRFSIYEQTPDVFPDEVDGIQLEIGDYPKEEALEKIRELMKQIDSASDLIDLYENYNTTGKHRMISSHPFLPCQLCEIYSSSKTYIESLRRLPGARDRLERAKEEVERLEKRETLELADRG